MKVGFLADDTDHGTRELREICKGQSNSPLIGSALMSSRGPSSRPSLPSSTGERSKGSETPFDSGSIREI